jgi:hypothetical protein
LFEDVQSIYQWKPIEKSDKAGAIYDKDWYEETSTVPKALMMKKKLTNLTDLYDYFMKQEI